MKTQKGLKDKKSNTNTFKPQISQTTKHEGGGGGRTTYFKYKHIFREGEEL